jgi:hypothetical protein
MQSTESPIFDAQFWSENGVSCPHKRNKIGDSVLWMDAFVSLYNICKMGLQNTNARDESLVTRRCVAFFLDGCVCIFVKYLQDGFTKIQTHAMT